MAVIQGAQPGVPILELGDSSRVLAAVERDEMGPETVQAIGRRYGVDAVLMGTLETERPRPSFSVNSFVESMNASAEIEGVLSARILQTRSGATIWTNAARGKESVAQVRVAQGSLPQFGARDPEGAESRLVLSLVTVLSNDFKPRWERR